MNYFNQGSAKAWQAAGYSFVMCNKSGLSVACKTTLQGESYSEGGRATFLNRSSDLSYAIREIEFLVSRLADILVLSPYKNVSGNYNNLF